jgi:hypothetical protein
MTSGPTTEGEAMLALAEVIHKARWPEDQTLAITPFADEDRNGREYCLRIAGAVMASRAVGMREALQQIDKICSDYERVMLLPDVKGLKKIWRIASAALSPDTRLIETVDNSPKPKCELCGRSVFDPCTSKAMAAGCELPY